MNIINAWTVAIGVIFLAEVVVFSLLIKNLKGQPRQNSVGSIGLRDDG